MKTRVAFAIFAFCLGAASRILAPLMAFAEPEVVSSVSRTLVAAPWAATMPIGDLNQDGVSELLGYRALGFSEVQFSGEAKIFSGVSGQVLGTVRGEAADDQFCGDASALGDVDGDNIPDFILASGHDALNRRKRKRYVRVYSGATRAVLYEHYYTKSFDALRVLGLGDMNGDGRGDYAVASSVNNLLRIHSGKTGKILRTHRYAPLVDDGVVFEGESLAAADVDGDSIKDILLVNRARRHERGVLSIYSGKSGKLLLRREGALPFTQRFRTVHALGDLTGDGKEEFGIGYGGRTGAKGRLEIFRGGTFTSMKTLRFGSLAYFDLEVGPTDSYDSKALIAALGDVNVDGHHDFAMVLRNTSSPEKSVVNIVSGKNFATLATILGSTRIGSGQDFNGDGLNDLAVNRIVPAPIPRPFTERAAEIEHEEVRVHEGFRVLSGSDFSTELVGRSDSPSTNGNFGYSVANLGDVDGDGWKDLIVGAPFDDLGSVNAGSAQVISSRTGALIREHSGRTSLDGLGFAITALGDIDSDGAGDYLLEEKVTGAISAYSGATGELAYQLRADNLGQFIGDNSYPTNAGAPSIRAQVGDINGDGISDFYIYREAYSFGDRVGSTAEYHSGRTGMTIPLPQTAEGRSECGLGRLIGDLGDINQDGYGDVLYYRAGATDTIAKICSPFLGVVLGGDLNIGTPYLGPIATFSVGDIDGGGMQEIAVTVPRFIKVPNGKAQVLVVDIFRGESGERITTISPPLKEREVLGAFGVTGGSVPDMNADGVRDIVIGGPRAVYFYSGKEFSLLDKLTLQSGPSDGGLAGSILSVVANLDGQGAAGIFVGGRRSTLDHASDAPFWAYKQGAVPAVFVVRLP